MIEEIPRQHLAIFGETVSKKRDGASARERYSILCPFFLLSIASILSFFTSVNLYCMACRYGARKKLPIHLRMTLEYARELFFSFFQSTVIYDTCTCYIYTRVGVRFFKTQSTPTSYICIYEIPSVCGRMEARCIAKYFTLKWIVGNYLLEYYGLIRSFVENSRWRNGFFNPERRISKSNFGKNSCFYLGYKFLDIREYFLFIEFNVCHSKGVSHILMIIEEV